MQVKLFQAEKIADFESLINGWLGDNQNDNITVHIRLLQNYTEMEQRPNTFNPQQPIVNYIFYLYCFYDFEIKETH